MAKTRLCAAIAALSVPGMALAASDIPLLDTLDATGAVYFAEELGVTAEGATVINGFSFERFMNRFSADRLVMEGDSYILENVRITQEKGGDGIIHADRMVLDGADSIWALYTLGGFMPSRDETGAPLFAETDEEYETYFNNQDSECGGLQGQGTTSRRLGIEGFYMGGDLDGMPLGLSYGEGFSAQGVQAYFDYGIKDDICDVKVDVRLDKPLVTSISADTLEASSGTLTWTGSVNMTDGYGTTGQSYTLEDVVLTSSAGTKSLGVGRFAYNIEQNVKWASFTCIVLMGFDVFPRIDFEEAFSEGRHDLSFDMSGIEIDVANFFPADMIRDLGLEDIDTISGHMTANSVLADGRNALGIDVELPGIVDLDITANLDFPKERSAVLPPMLSDKIPVPSEIMQLEIRRLEATFADQGIGRIVESYAGQRPAAILDNVYAFYSPTIAGKVPGFLVGKIDTMAASMSDFIAKGGTFRIAPEQPVSVVNLAMQSLMNPAGITALDGVSLQLME
jgi:hypothetical protein